MDIIVKSSHGISLVPLESRLLSDRKLFIEGEITTALAGRFAKAAMLLQNEDAKKPIDIYLNSPGGAVDAGLLIYDTIKGMPERTVLHCMGMAGSVAAIILAGGKKGVRHILPHSRVMIHEPLIPGGLGGSLVYLPGGMNKKTCVYISEMLNRPLDEVMFMEMGNVIVFQSGKQPVIAPRYDTLADALCQEFLKNGNGAKRVKEGG